MSGPPSIRRAEPRDIEALLGIEGSWPTTPKWTRGHFESELGKERAYLCVLESPEGVVGYGGLWLLPPEAQVTIVAIHPARARRGLGADLMLHLHEKAESSGCRLLTLEVSAVNRPALALYTKLGYQIVGRRPKYYNDGSDALLMNLQLRHNA